MKAICIYHRALICVIHFEKVVRFDHMIHFKRDAVMVIGVMRPKHRFLRRIAETQNTHISSHFINERIHHRLSNQFTFRNESTNTHTPFKGII